MKLFGSEVYLVPSPHFRQRMTKRRRKPVQKPSESDVVRYFAELETLALALPAERLNWYLEGGLALATYLDGFQREHSDIDIGVLSEDLETLEECLAEHNYRLFSRNPLLHLVEYARVDVVHAASIKAIRSERRTKRLTAIKVDDNGAAAWGASVLPRFDVHVHIRGEDVVYLTHRRVPFPADLFFDTSTYQTPGDRTIPVASIPFIYFFKWLGRKPRQQFDKQLIEESGLLSEDARSRVLELLKIRDESVGQPASANH